MVTNVVSDSEYCRSVLLSVVGEPKTAQLDFLLLPDSKSTGEIILHIAGFEYLLISLACLHKGQEPDYELWQPLKPGFAREARFAAPRGLPFAYYRDLLARVRARTVRYFGEAQNQRKVRKETLFVEALVSRLCANDANDDAAAYEKLAAGAGRSIHDDGAIDENGQVDLVNLLVLHETYHRGHITLLNYIYSRLRAGCELATVNA
jgi:hypothetical protein